jgi:high-affinity nickel-transport protein
MYTILGLGFLLGMRHALEADHAAAVASLATQSRSVTQTMKQGIVWGLGHSMTLFLFGSIVLIVGVVIPERIADGLECAVGFMLVGLGLDVFRRMRNERIHFHLHQHSHATPHFHAHSHAPDMLHTEAAHQHAHPQGFPYRAFIVGLMHGMAGSAALILLTLNIGMSPSMAIGYIVVFGLGSVLGMGLLSVMITIPLWYSARSLTWVHHNLQGVVGIGTILLGGYVISQHSHLFM